MEIESSSLLLRLSSHFGVADKTKRSIESCMITRTLHGVNLELSHHRDRMVVQIKRYPLNGQTPPKISLTFSTATGTIINYNSFFLPNNGVISTSIARAFDLEAHAAPQRSLKDFGSSSNSNPARLGCHRR